MGKQSKKNRKVERSLSTFVSKELPAIFLEYLNDAAGELAPKIVAAIEENEPVVSIRLNPFKSVGCDVDSVVNDAIKEGNRIPWCANGFYLSRRPQFTFDPTLHAGAYYVQEPSSMFLEMLRPVLQSLSPRNVLDLCAAPGGKSTHLISMLPLGTRFTVNEVVKPRLSALRENILKWGVPGIQITSKEAHQFAPNDFPHSSNHISNHYVNIKVTSNSNINPNSNANPSDTSNANPNPNRTAENYLNDVNRIGSSENFSSDLFDFILVDAPCSGEGMFRKDPGAISEWSEENVKMCAARQKKIVQEIWGALRPGGLLAYSTCTFNRYENDMNVAWMKRELGASLISLEKFYKSQGLEHIFSDKIREEWGIKKSEEGGYQFFPGIVRGEGLYLALLYKPEFTSETELSGSAIFSTETAASGSAIHSAEAAPSGSQKSSTEQKDSNSLEPFRSLGMPNQALKIRSNSYVNSVDNTSRTSPYKTSSNKLSTNKFSSKKVSTDSTSNKPSTNRPSSNKLSTKKSFFGSLSDTPSLAPSHEEALLININLFNIDGVAEQLFDGKTSKRSGYELIPKLQESEMISKFQESELTDKLSDYESIPQWPEHELTKEQAIKFLSRESLVLEGAPTGYLKVTYGGLGLGFVKNIGSRANNLLPTNLRIRKQQ
ncbi:MAG: hypothetical protein A2X19_06560 [Bacteroidetes bacterium GWE2_39_28]|nr:MAG: hypothetical protein A2X19_06560 [Bacteroidetes bacterium GWE2_39_28]OFY14314.1 MAG: hypothetical protein A2X16_09645 [Bacteroidetes bacterium GWF2_39_10]HCT94511.1 hypothetical protein [Rikenellaceae bacterium]